ncbi:MAG: Arc family DNA-binding protein [Planctomycetes bacterium]|nr:Arc family DNA-binding protein [Planctomycetota bacterium]
MAQLVIRGIDEEMIKRLRKQAEYNGRTLQSEIKMILQQATRVDVEDALELADRIRARFGNRKFDDSAELIREDRER